MIILVVFFGGRGRCGFFESWVFVIWVWWVLWERSGGEKGIFGEEICVWNWESVEVDVWWNREMDGGEEERKWGEKGDVGEGVWVSWGWDLFRGSYRGYGWSVKDERIRRGKENWNGFGWRGGWRRCGGCFGL